MGQVLNTKKCPVCAGKHNFPVPTRAASEPGSRVSGWQLMYSMLQSLRWVIGRDCTRLVEVLPLLSHDEDNANDVLKIPGDDAADSARYGLYSRLRARQAPLAVRVAAKVTAKDPTARAIQAKRALIEEQRKTAPHVPKRPWRVLWTPR